MDRLVPRAVRAIEAPTGGGTQGERRPLTTRLLPRAVRKVLPALDPAEGLPEALAAMLEATRSSGSFCRPTFRRRAKPEILVDLDGTFLEGDSSVWAITALLEESPTNPTVFQDRERASLRQGLKRLIDGGLVSAQDLASFGFHAQDTGEPTHVGAAEQSGDATWGWGNWYSETKEVIAAARQRDAHGLEEAIRAAVARPAFQAKVFDPMRTALQFLATRSQIVAVSGALDPVPTVVLASLLTPKNAAKEFLSDLRWTIFGRHMLQGSAMVIGASSARQIDPYAAGKAPRVTEAVRAAKQAGTRVAALVVDSATGDGPAILAAIDPADHEVNNASWLRVPVIVIVNANDEMHRFLAEHDRALELWKNRGGQLFHVKIPSPSSEG